MYDTQKYQQDSLGKIMSQLYHKKICLTYDDYINYLISVEDWTEIIEQILERCKVTHLDQERQEEAVLLYALLEKLAYQLPICARDENYIKQTSKFLLGTKVSDELNAENNEIFLKRHAFLKIILEYAKFMKIEKVQTINDKFGCDFRQHILLYQEDAYCLLKYWQHYDVMFYEQFMYRLISQFKELYVELQEAVQCDVCDLYMWHGDEEKAHRAYQQLLKQSADYGKIACRYAQIVQRCAQQKVNSLVKKLLEGKKIDTHWQDELNAMIS